MHQLAASFPTEIIYPAVAIIAVLAIAAVVMVYCLNALTGAKIWNYTTQDGVDSSPAVAGGYVYVGGWDGNVYCLNSSTGANIWTYTTGNHVSSSPAVWNGIVYVGSWDHYVYAFGNLLTTSTFARNSAIALLYSRNHLPDSCYNCCCSHRRCSNDFIARNIS